MAAGSWFSSRTAGALRSESIDSVGHAVVDFEDLRPLIPNASSSAGSEMLLQELNAAVFGVAVDMVTSWGEHTPGVLNLLAFIEDEGEFVMIIAMFAVSVGIFDVERQRIRSAAAGEGTLRAASA